MNLNEFIDWFGPEVGNCNDIPDSLGFYMLFSEKLPPIGNINVPPKSRYSDASQVNEKYRKYVERISHYLTKAKGGEPPRRT